MSTVATQSARLWILQVELPGGDLANAGVLLEDPSTDRLHIRMRHDWDQIVEDSEILEELEPDLEAKSREMGAAALLKFLSDTLSNVLRIADPRDVIVEDFDRALGRLYRQIVATVARPFVTHLPRYSLAVAGGKFLENQEVSEEGWEEVRAGLRLDDRMFVARVVGRSMEPRIPDGALCVFRAGVTGSRQGRLLLVESQGSGSNDRYTIKRYRSEKKQAPDGTWAHERILLEPLNPEFEAWELDPDENRFRILAEFVEVLD